MYVAGIPKKVSTFSPAKHVANTAWKQQAVSCSPRKDICVFGVFDGIPNICCQQVLSQKTANTKPRHVLGRSGPVSLPRNIFFDNMPSMTLIHQL